MRTIITISSGNEALSAAVHSAAEGVARVMELSITEVDYGELSGIDRVVDELDAALLIAGIGSGGTVQAYLNFFRELRIPYMFCKAEHTAFAPTTILLPVTNLMEDREKGPYASSFARHFHADVCVVKPHDYGSKAQGNIDAIVSLFDSLGVGYSVLNSKSDSMKVERSALSFSRNPERELLIISASRDYGLDDMVFGPKERKTIRLAAMPVLVVNPRADLYPLCD